MSETNWPDIINGVVFEFIGGLLLWINVRKLSVDKKVRGVDWRVTGFWTSWGLFNLYFYASQELWWSWVGGMNIVLANSFWLYLAWKYRHN